MSIRDKIIISFISFIVENKWLSNMGKWAIPKDIHVTDDLPTWVGGKFEVINFAPTIKVRQKYKNDTGLINHEKCHARQFGRLLFIHIVAYKYSKTYRLLSELEAYREQVKTYRYSNIDDYAWIPRALHRKYNLGLSRAKINIYCNLCFKDLLEENRK